MKTDEQVDTIMLAIPKGWRSRWCGGEAGSCACLGCVYTGSKAVVASKILGAPYLGDPEHIPEPRLRIHKDLYDKYMLTREEWEAWTKRQPPQ